MIAPRTTPQVAPVEWWYDAELDEASELETRELLEMETAARETPEDEGVDDEIVRATEELRADEG